MKVGRIDYADEIEEIDKQIIKLAKPVVYAEKEVQFVKNFDKNCIALTQHFNIQQPKKLSVREFLIAMKEMKDYFKANNSRYGKSNSYI